MVAACAACAIQLATACQTLAATPSATAPSGEAAVALAPANAASPVVHGVPAVGAVLYTTSGVWSGAPTSYTYAWEDCNSAGAACAVIPGARSWSHTVTPAEVGHTIRSTVTEHSASGAASATSASTGVIIVAASPLSGSTPKIRGLTHQGQRLVATPGMWLGIQPITFTYQWRRCKPVCTRIAGATTSTYVLQAPDVSYRIQLIVTAKNGIGSRAVESAQSAAVGAPVSSVAIDGGSGYFAALSPQSAWLDSHILLGSWEEQPQNVTEVGYDRAAGENLYWNLGGTPGNPSNAVADYDVIRAGGMRVSAPSGDAASGSETVMWDGSDESDMNFGAGSSVWRDNGTYNTSACSPSGSACGFTAAGFYYTGDGSSVLPAGDSTGYPVDGRAVHQGYGKGVLFWESDADAEVFMRYSDIPSADSYWMTDTDLEVPSQGGCALLPSSATACGGGNGSGLTQAQSELPANYAFDVTALERLDRLAGLDKPIAVDVETGCPFGSGSSDGGHCTTPPAMVASAWHALIAGARGIIWFQHNFSGNCPTDRAIIDGSNPASGDFNCVFTPGYTLHNMVQALTAFDDEVTSLTGVLLSPTAVGYVTTTGDVSTVAKASGGSCYVFAGSGRPVTPPAANQSVTFKVADGFTGTVSVYDENRTVHATNGTFTDTFANANSVHVYQIPGSTCG
jgi:hypothetical protein